VVLSVRVQAWTTRQEDQFFFFYIETPERIWRGSWTSVRDGQTPASQRYRFRWGYLLLEMLRSRQVSPESQRCSAQLHRQNNSHNS
jgi:hypothetical protein